MVIILPKKEGEENVHFRTPGGSGRRVGQETVVTLGCEPCETVWRKPVRHTLRQITRTNQRMLATDRGERGLRVEQQRW